ncbi:Estradiol 17-beta-dehydrogenase 8 [Brachionus plicatilis]|uniref:(3R)-3-hydroxyacyl-CoA dehydrogenase n=1 Tax=Brachionus plicatilis TaxID=10195 RepID=A0A3M7T734_BRAPC|nr:Estradiol 17-beta-dehydrogenase 8 [Brachionus plicatilis]
MLANKLALITGGASGIGKSIAKLYAKNGANLCLADLSRDTLNKLSEEIQTENKDRQIRISTHTCDVSISGDVENLFKSIRESHESTPNVVVNSAGITRDQVMLKMSEKDFDKVINVNLKGTFLVNQLAVRCLMENLKTTDPSKMPTYASLINLASVVGKYGNIGQTNYAASKAGVEGMTKTIAKEIGKFNIRCNAILPGLIETPMTNHVPENILQKIIKSVPLRRIGQPQDIAQLALFLASDSSSYITGASIECSGGMAF